MKQFLRLIVLLGFIAPFSHACRVGDLVFITGQMPTVPETNEMLLGTFTEFYYRLNTFSGAD